MNAAVCVRAGYQHPSPLPREERESLERTAMLEQVQVLARKLARTPLSKELRAAGIKQLRVLALFGSYVNLLEAAGFTPQHKPQLRKRASRFRLAVVCGQCHKHSQPSFRREALWLQGEVEFSPCPFCHYPNPRGNVKLVSEDL